MKAYIEAFGRPDGCAASTMMLKRRMQRKTPYQIPQSNASGTSGVLVTKAVRERRFVRYKCGRYCPGGAYLFVRDNIVIMIAALPDVHTLTALQLMLQPKITTGNDLDSSPQVDPCNAALRAYPETSSPLPPSSRS